MRNPAFHADVQLVALLALSHNRNCLKFTLGLFGVVDRPKIDTSLRAVHRIHVWLAV